MSDNDFDFPEEIVELEDVDDNPNILIFSKPGAGKTTFLGSDDNVLIFNCESSGVISAKRSNTLGKNVRQWPVKQWTDFVKGVEWLQEQVRQGKELPFRWVAIDTLTTLQDRILMRHILNEVHEKNPSKRSLYIPDKPEYLRNQLMLVEYIKQLNDLPIGVLYSAHVMQQADPEGHEFYYPQIQGGTYKVAQQVLAMMTSFGYMFVKDVKTKEGKPTGKKDRYIMWEDSGHMQGKDRTMVFGQFTKNATLRELRERMEAKDKELQANSTPK